MCALLLCVRRTRLRSDAAAESDTVVDGGQFTGCRSVGNGAFMFAEDGALVTILGGTVTDCVAERRAGVVSGRSSVSTDTHVPAVLGPIRLSVQ